MDVLSEPGYCWRDADESSGAEGRGLLPSGSKTLDRRTWFRRRLSTRSTMNGGRLPSITRSTT